MKLLAVWVVATLAGLVFALTTKIGPAFYNAPGHGHGLHVGDALGFACVWCLAAAVTVWMAGRRTT